jgi:hypothetical protein
MRTLTCGFFALVLSISQLNIYGQTSKSDSLQLTIPEKILDGLNKSSSDIQSRLDATAKAYLRRIRHHEKKLKKILWKRDSVSAKELFATFFEIPEAKQPAAIQNCYSAKLDSLSTALRFIHSYNTVLVNNVLLKATRNELNDLQTKLEAVEDIKQYLTERENILRTVFQQCGLLKKIRSFQKQVYYYKAEIQSIKTVLENPQNLQRKLIEQVMKHPAFSRFFDSHSQLATLFHLSGSSLYNTGTNVLQGLQTRNDFNQQINHRFGSGADVSDALQQNIASAQQQIDRLKEKLPLSSISDNSNYTTPQFRPNLQKTKTFLSRIEYGANVQSQKARFFFPVTTDIGLFLGYKLNDRSALGFGASYKIGWGRSWDQIAITHQGVGLRSYIDWKIKSSIYLSGGFEQNYRNGFYSLSQLEKFKDWQQSGLIGLSKKYQLSKKIKGDIKFLWDFLSYQQLPKTQTFLFRFGYSLK